MRRLAVQDREDSYNSARDYQRVENRKAVRIEAVRNDSISLVLYAPVKLERNSRFLAWGGYIKANKDCVLRVSLLQGGAGKIYDFEIGRSWRRVGGLMDIAGAAADAEVSLILASDVDSFDIWGLDLSPVDFSFGGQTIQLEELDRSHLIPEVFYLDHLLAIGLDINDDSSSRFKILDGDDISVKKCSYCGRYLPLDSARPGVLAFHKHSAKVTGHQNECRACKKLRINDSLNRLRTTDQLHESSVITRERKVFLREPEILQVIKERAGRGLKSIIWEKFGRSCFRCRTAVRLNEFQLDHTRPLAYLWPIDEYATCLCAVCNNEKKDKFPVDFYSDNELVRLSGITGLGLDQLRSKSLNQFELDRILADLPGFARSWEPRTFAATGRKIRELRPDIDLLALLDMADPSLGASVRAALAERPLAQVQD